MRRASPACQFAQILSVQSHASATAALPARILQPGGLGLLSPRTAQRLEHVVGLFRQLDSLEVIEVHHPKSQSGRNLRLVPGEKQVRHARCEVTSEC